MDFPYYLCLVYIVKCMQSSMNSKVLLLCARRLMDKNANCKGFLIYISELISTLSRNGMSTDGSHKHKQNGENVRQRSTRESANGEAVREEKSYTPEQLQAVKKYVMIWE